MYEKKQDGEKKLKRLIGVLACAFALSGQANATTYTYTDLGTMTVSASGWMGINNRGQAAGATIVDGVQRATIYTNGAIQVLETFGGNQTTATSINDNGEVTGFSATTENGNQHAFLFTNGVMKDLGTLGGHLSMGFGINDSGQVVGFSYDSIHAFLYSNGTMTDIGTMGGSYSVATAINNRGQITGYASTSDRHDQAFLYSDGTMTNIGTLDASGWANPLAINDYGAVTGYSNGRAFLYIDGKMIDIGVSGVGYDVNNAGQVVGTASRLVDGYEVRSGFLYSEENGLVDLNSLLSPESDLKLISANGINDLGQILGLGLIHNELHDVILNPVSEEGRVPEPGALALVGLALGALVVSRKTKYRTS